MAKKYYNSSSEFNIEVVRDFLLGLTVPPEMGERFGVPASQLEHWIHELAASLDTGRLPTYGKNKYAQPPQECDTCGKLSDGEIHFLLDELNGKHHHKAKRHKRSMK